MFSGSRALRRFELTKSRGTFETDEHLQMLTLSISKSSGQLVTPGTYGWKRWIKLSSVRRSITLTPVEVRRSCWRASVREAKQKGTRDGALLVDRGSLWPSPCRWTTAQGRPRLMALASALTRSNSGFCHGAIVDC